MAHHPPLAAQAQLAYDAALNSSCPDWRGVAELFRAALRPHGRPRQQARAQHQKIADYNVDRIKLKTRSPSLCVRFMDGEAIFTHCPSAPNNPLNVGRALRVAICMWRYRVYRRLGYRQYETTIPVPEIFQVRCLETDELFDVGACNRHTAAERASIAPERADAALLALQEAA